MNEDVKLNDFLKERLEAGVPGEPPRLETILHAASAAAQARAAARRRSVFLWGGFLVAASLAVLCFFAVHFQTSSTPSSPSSSSLSASSPSQSSLASSPAPVPSPAYAPSPEQTVVDAIDLLCMTDGEELDIETNSVEEVLLAWQDAPYEDAVSDLFEGN